MKKEIIFKENNFDKIQVVIDEAQKKCSVILLSIEAMKDALEGVEEKLNIPKKHLDGVRVIVDVNAQDFPSAYKYAPESTIFKAYYKNGSWRITDVFRGTPHRGWKEADVYLTEEAKSKILENYRFLHVA